MLMRPITAYDSRIAQMFRNLRGLGIHSILPAAFVTHRRWYLADGGSIVDPSAEIVDGDGSILRRNAGVVRATANRLRISRADFGVPGVGVRVEPDVTQFLSDTHDFNTASWTNSGGVTFSTDSDVAPDGTLTADTLTDSNVSVRENVFQSITIVSNTSRVFAEVYVKKTVGASSFPAIQLAMSPAGNRAEVTINTDTGVLTAVAGRVPVFSDIRSAGDFWYVTIAALNTSKTAAFLQVIPAQNTDGSGSQDNSATGSAVCWGTHIYQLGFPTSHIFGDASLRTGDDLMWPNTGEQLVPAAEGAIIVVVVPGFDASALADRAMIIDTREASQDNGFLFQVDNASNLYQYDVRSGAVTVSALTSTTVPTRGVPDVIMITWKLNDFRFIINGVQEASNGAGAAPLVLNPNVFVGQRFNNIRLFSGIIGPIFNFKRSLTLRQGNSVIHREIAPIWPGRLRMLA